MNAPSTIAPHLSTEQAEYMALVAPDEVSVEELIEIFHREGTFMAHGAGNGIDPPEPEFDVMAGIQAVRDAAIAAAEPHIRKRVLSEAIAMAKVASSGTVTMWDGEGRMSHVTVAEWLEIHSEALEAEATRPDADEEVSL